MSEDRTSEKYLLTGEDIKKLAGPGTLLMEYPELKRYGSIDELFSKGVKNVILLYLADKTPYSATGHWVCLTKRGSTIEFFCPYGLMPDTAINWNKSKAKKQSLDQDENTLSRLLDHFSKRGGKVEYNERQLQSRDPNIATCGRYVGTRCRFNKLSTKEFQDTLLQHRKDGVDLDELITGLSNKLLGW